MIEMFVDGVKTSSGSAIDLNESTGIDITATGDGHVADYTISVEETHIRYANVPLTNAEIIGLNATAKELVAAPGAGKMLEFLSATLQLNYGGSNVFTESADNLLISYVDASGVAVTGAIEATGFIDATADAFTTAPAIAVVNANTAQVTNTALVLANTGDGEYAGNAAADNTMSVFVAYRIHTLA